MARNAIKSDFRSSKMAAGGHFVKNKKLRIDLKWREMRSKVIFSHPKWPPPAILWKYFAIFPNFSQLFPLFPNFSQLFTTFHHFSPLFTTFSTFSNFSPLFTTFHHFSPLFANFPHFNYCIHLYVYKPLLFTNMDTDLNTVPEYIGQHLSPEQLFLVCLLEYESSIFPRLYRNLRRDSWVHLHISTYRPTHP